MTDGILVVGGIDTHTGLYQAAVIDSIGRHLATEQFETTPEGYQRLLDWPWSHGEVGRRTLRSGAGRGCHPRWSVAGRRSRGRRPAGR